MEKNSFAQSVAAHLVPGAKFVCSRRGNTLAQELTRETILLGGLMVVYRHPPAPVLVLQGPEGRVT